MKPRRLAITGAMLLMPFLFFCSNRTLEVAGLDASPGAEPHAAPDASCPIPAESTIPCGDASCNGATEHCSVLHYDCRTPNAGCPDAGPGNYYFCAANPSACNGCPNCACILPDAIACSCEGTPGNVVTICDPY
jgi:hypothetical protein